MICNLAKVPSHAVMTKAGNSNMAHYVRLLLNASELYSNDSGSFALFDSSKYSGKDLLFKDSTEKLVNVSGQTYLEFLGEDYVAVIEGLDNCTITTTPASTTAATTTTNNNNNKGGSFLASVGLAFLALLLS